MKKTNDLLSNEKCKIQYDASLKEISGKDLIDEKNDPRFFTTSKRGISKAWEVLQTTFTQHMTMQEAPKNPLLQVNPADLISLLAKDLFKIPYKQLFNALKFSETVLCQTIFRMAIQQKNAGLPFDITLGFAQRRCRIIETNRRKKFVRRTVKSAPLFALSLIRERYPDYVESMIAADLKLGKGYKRRDKLVKRPSDMGLRICQIRKLNSKLGYADPESKEYNTYCNQIAGYMNGLKTKSPIIIEVKYNKIKMEYAFAWNATESKVKSFVALANKLTSFEDLDQELSKQNRYGG